MRSKNLAISAIYILIGILFILFPIDPIKHPWILVGLGLFLITTYAMAERQYPNLLFGIFFSAVLLLPQATFYFLIELNVISEIRLSFLFLALSFLIIYCIRPVQTSNGRLWPIIPSIVCLLIGFPDISGFPIWPFIFIGLGIFQSTIK